MLNNSDELRHHIATKQTEDPFLLGSTSGQRSAEMVAAIRAITEQTPEDMVLSTYAGRTFAQLLNRIAGSPAFTNVTSNRHASITALVEKVIAAHPEGLTVIELASGFSPRAWRLAQRYPHILFTEIDQPDVVEEKRTRLRKLCGDNFPANLTWNSADLATTPLSQLLGDKKVNLVICEGLLPYFTPDQITRLVSTVYDSLAENGIMISDMVNRPGWEVVQDSASLAERMLSAQIGKFAGYAKSKEEVASLFKTAGFSRVEVNYLEDMVEQLNLLKPVTNTSYIQVAYK